MEWASKPSHAIEVLSFIINLWLWLMCLTIWRTLGGYGFAPSLRAYIVRSTRSSAFLFTRSQPPMALSVPLRGWRFFIGGGSAFYVRRHYTLCKNCDLYICISAAFLRRCCCSLLSQVFGRRCIFSHDLCSDYLPFTRHKH